MEIRIINRQEREKAMELVLDVFMLFVAPDYGLEGIETFKAFIRNNDQLEEHKIYGAYEGNELVGVTALKNDGKHIALFFINEKWQRQGIGRRLFKEVVQNSGTKVITVNSAPSAVTFYEKLGFAATGSEQLASGIRYVPMKYNKKY